MKTIKIKYALFMSLTLAILISWGFLAWVNTEDKLNYNSSSIIQSIEQISELSLVQYNYTTVIGLKANKSIGKVDIPLTGKSFLATYDGLIKAGVELPDNLLDQAEVQDKRIALKLPKAVITNHAVDESSLVVYDQSKNIINLIKIEDYNNAIVEEKKEMEQKAIESGILTQAEERAALMLKGLLANLGYTQVEITFG